MRNLVVRIEHLAGFDAFSQHTVKLQIQPGGYGGNVLQCGPLRAAAILLQACGRGGSNRLHAGTQIVPGLTALVASAAAAKRPTPAAALQQSGDGAGSGSSATHARRFSGDGPWLVVPNTSCHRVLRDAQHHNGAAGVARPRLADTVPAMAS